jgi:hypothetical protein
MASLNISGKKGLFTSLRRCTLPGLFIHKFNIIFLISFSLSNTIVHEMGL